jgi:putative DNA methylase
MTRMIERWFPCQEVSENSEGGWGSGNAEANLFTWFAKRPLAQAKAAVLTSLLPWPDEASEQRRLQELVRNAFAGRDAAHQDLVAELRRLYPVGSSILDPFSGRAMIPLEAARLGVKSWGIDYSPVATIAGQLLADYPMRDWSGEPNLPFPGYSDAPSGRLLDGRARLLRDVEFILNLIGERYERSMDEFYPLHVDHHPWGYLWSVTLPCQECGNRYPLIGSLVLQTPVPRSGYPGQSYRLGADKATGHFWVEVESGPPSGQPTRVLPPSQSRHSSKGRPGVCPFCGQVHPKEVLERLAGAGLGRDVMLLVADLDPDIGKSFRLPTAAELDAVNRAQVALAAEPAFGPGMPARPNEPIPPGNTWTIQPSLFGAATYGDLCNDRQALGFVRLARTINELGAELLAADLSPEYAAALCGYAGAALVRKMRRSTRGAALQTYNDGRPTGVHDIFGNSESSIAFSYDYFETGLTRAAGGWRSICERTIATLRTQLTRPPGRPAIIQQGSALSLPIPPNSVDAVVTDPPYDDMIDYTDASDLFFVWLKRALATTHPGLSITGRSDGLQDKAEEIIVKKGGTSCNDHRTPAFYDTKLAEAFASARKVVRDDGVVTIVFGHGDPDVWHRLLTAITSAGLVLTGSWPARTEKGGSVGSANIVTTLTLACRPAPPERGEGRVNEVDAEVRRQVAERLPLWDAAGLALNDQLMSSAGPAMEVVGRYSMILDKRGEPVDLERYLPLARRAVKEAADIRIDSLPLGTFDARTQFALFWARANGRAVMPGSEARWHRLASDLTEDDTRRILTVKKGVRLAYGKEAAIDVGSATSVIDIAFGLAAAGRSLASAAEVLVNSDRADDAYLWAAVGELARSVPEADPDGETWTWLVRNRHAITTGARNVEATRRRLDANRAAGSAQQQLPEED